MENKDKAPEITERPNREYMTQIETKYTNIVSFEGGFYDFKLYFGLKKDIANPSLDPTDFHTAIIMSPEHAKEMSKLLQSQLKHYEDNIGLINEVPSGE